MGDWGSSDHVNGWGSHPADRVNDENQETVEAEDDDEDTQSLDRHHKSIKAEEAKLKTRLAELNKQEKTHITFSGLLNVIDGPGAKEGRFLILTTNAIRSLDGALRRHGRCDRTWYMSRATPAMAAVTFRRIFGQDPCRTHDLPEIHRLSLEFGKQVTPDTFAPCEIQEYCMSHRGQPEQAVEDWQRYLQMKASGEDDVQYDINDEEQAEPDYLTGAPEGWDKALDSYDQYMEGLNKMTEHELSGSSMQQLRAPPPEESLAFGDFHSEVPRDEPDDGVLEAVRGVFGALFFGPEYEDLARKPRKPSRKSKPAPEAEVASDVIWPSDSISEVGAPRWSRAHSDAAMPNRRSDALQLRSPSPTEADPAGSTASDSSSAMCSVLSQMELYHGEDHDVSFSVTDTEDALCYGDFDYDSSESR